METECGLDMINPEGNWDTLKNSGSGPGMGRGAQKTGHAAVRSLHTARTSVLRLLWLGGGVGNRGGLDSNCHNPRDCEGCPGESRRWASVDARRDAAGLPLTVLGHVQSPALFPERKAQAAPEKWNPGNRNGGV